jgi:penicillin-binding protein 1C
VDHPAPGTVFAVAGQEEGATIELRASVLGGDGTAPVGLVEFVVDGRVVGRSPAPYRFGLAATPGDHEVEARPIDATLPVRLYRSRFSVR